MDIHGCHVISEPSDLNPEGFSTTVHRDGVIKGPFATIQEAIKCASVWTASTNESVQVPPPKMEPPVVPFVNPTANETVRPTEGSEPTN